MDEFTNTEKSLLYHYHEQLKFYFRQKKQIIKDVTLKEIEALQVAAELLDLVEMSAEDWVKAQFFWWHKWFDKPIPLQYIGTTTCVREITDGIKTQRNAFWRARNWKKIKGTEDDTGRPLAVAPVDTSFSRLHLFFRRKLELLKRTGRSVAMFIMNMIPPDAYYLFSSKGLAMDNKFYKDFLRVREKYFKQYAGYPMLEALA